MMNDVGALLGRGVMDAVADACNGRGGERPSPRLEPECASFILHRECLCVSVLLRCAGQTLKSTQAMAEAMKGTTKAMRQMNRQLKLPALQKILQEFEMQNERMEMTSEVMGDALDDVMEGDGEEEETEELVNQVLDEIGIDINNQVCSRLSARNTVMWHSSALSLYRNVLFS